MKEEFTCEHTDKGILCGLRVMPNQLEETMKKYKKVLCHKHTPKEEEVIEEKTIATIF